MSKHKKLSPKSPKSSPKPSTSQGSDWTRLLTDPDLVSHLSTLLRTYREVSPQQREAALLSAMREIKEAAVKAREANGSNTAPAVTAPQASLQSPEPVKETPPFEPELFNLPSPSDRRRFTRMKCCVAVEIHVEGFNNRFGVIWLMLAAEDAWLKPPLPCRRTKRSRSDYGSGAARSG